MLSKRLVLRFELFVLPYVREPQHLGRPFAKEFPRFVCLESTPLFELFLEYPGFVFVKLVVSQPSRSL